MSVQVETAPAEPRNRVWCSKMVGYFRRNRNRVTPGRLELPDCDFLNLAPRRTLRVLRPSLKSGRYYEPQSSRNRPESINDNFYTRWARRPHPSGNCRCSFRQSSNSSRLSTHEEKIISQEIQKIRSSLCEAERSGRDIQELERNLVVDLTQLEAPLDEGAAEQAEARANSDEECGIDTRLEPLGECVKKRIVKDLDRYIGDLLDEILNDTIKAIAQADNPFHRERRGPPAPAVPDEQPAAFDINFAFHGGEEVSQGAPSNPADKGDGESGYVNRGFVGTAGDPDALDFHLRHGLNGDAILEGADCIDSGINSVETIELQPEQEQNLEQSLIDIIDAKLGGASIGKSLEDLGMEIDTSEEPKAPKRKDRASSEAPSRTDSEPSSVPAEEVQPPAPKEKRVTIKETPVNSDSVDRASKSLDDAVEETNFNSLRLEFKRGGSVSSKDSETKPASPGNVGSRVNKTMSVIRRRIATRLGQARRKSGEPPPKSSGGPSKSTGRSGLELEDYRRRFPAPESGRPPRHHFKYEDFRRRDEDEVTLRNRKPMLVFIHGFGSSAEAFENQLRYFADLGYPCIAPDLLGHGLSSAPRGHGDYQFAKLLKDLEAVLLHYAFKPGQKCVIVAHNYGCSFATALASKYVGSVHQLVLISGGGPTPLAPPPSEGPGHCCLRASLAPLLFCGMNRAVLYSARGRQHPYCGPEQLAGQRPSHMRHVLRGMSWPEGDYVFHRRICTPTLLVHGLRDNKVSLVQECQMERTMIKAFLEAIPAAGHMPMTDCPEQLNHMIHCFIDLWKNKKW